MNKFVARSNHMIRRARLVGARIRSHRKALGLSQQRMADELGCVRSVISRIERGVGFPSLEWWINYATIYNLSLDIVLMGRDLTAVSSISQYTWNKVSQ